jgi:hypothetical protein
MATLSGGTIKTSRTSSLANGRILTVKRPKMIASSRTAWNASVTDRPIALSRPDGFPV